MGTLLVTHTKLELLHPVHGVAEKRNPLCSSKHQQQFRFGSKLSHWTWWTNGCVRAHSNAIMELVPENKKENLEFELPMYDPSKDLVVDLAVVGGDPAGLAVAQQVSEAGLSVCSIGPSPKLIWLNNYEVWVNEFEAMDLLDCLDTTWSSAHVFLDDQTRKFLDRPYGRVNRKLLKSKMKQKCISNGVEFHQAKVIKVIHEESRSLLICNGFWRCLVQYDKQYNPGYQVTYGILAEVEEHPFDLDKMVLMDWRDSHLTNKKDLREKNIPMEEIQERMVARLRSLGIKVRSIEEDERCVTPMGGSLPVLSQRVEGIGGSAGMVHLSTGYMVARTLASAPVVANSVVQGGRGNSSALVWIFCLSLGTRRFFDAFINLEQHYWHGFLSSRLFLPELTYFGLSLFFHALIFLE
ncbi:hypothetical protein NE237_009432 [Protea cynaroides]|uniref:Lycopene beta cyclase n=1 Tax=Protea cynaroides TaxID=273540 RepID=A0A9Q0KXH0_9MAGN|nr:hypothetical protein NE237_009432 [Protea cynaroides]